MVICARNSRGMGRAGHWLASGSAIKEYSDRAGLSVSPSDLHSAYTTQDTDRQTDKYSCNALTLDHVIGGNLDLRSYAIEPLVTHF